MYKISSILGAILAVILGVRTANAQSTIVPDGTLATEASIVNSLDPLPVDIINGGAIRGNNLFHSFSQFNVGANRGVYFFSPSANITNILARVTGGSRSEILGTLGTLGSSQPSLFLINPNGIIFGANATLDVGKSFVATTADGVQFGNQGIFSATKPEAPSLLTVNPSALLVNQIANSGNIINQSKTTAPVLGGFINGTPEERSRDGLGVVSGESLLLVGANINLDRGVLQAPGGKVELAAVTNGIVGLESADDGLKLNVPAEASRGDISLNQAIINTSDGKEVQLIGNNISFSDVSVIGGFGIKQVNIQASQFQMNKSGVFALPSEVSAAGNINIETGNLLLRETSLVDGGNVRLRSDNIMLNTAFIGGINTRLSSDKITLNTSFIGGKNTSYVAINTNSIKLSNSSAINASTSNLEQASKIQIQAKDSVDLVNKSIIGNIFNFGNSSIPNSGVDIEIYTRQLTMQNQSAIISSSSSSKIPRNITIRASDKVNLANISSILTSISTTSSSGNILIETGMLTLDGFSTIASSTLGTANSGEVILRVKDAVELSNSSSINSSTYTGSTGQAGNLTIQTGRLSLKEGSIINSSTLGAGNGGNISIQATDAIKLFGETSPSLVFSLISSSANFGSQGNSGDITINTGRLTITDGAQISTQTDSVGNAGDIKIKANNAIELTGEQQFVLGGTVSSGITTETNLYSSGKGGNLYIETPRLNIQGGATISTSTASTGDAGNLTIKATDINVFGKGFSSSSLSSGLGLVATGAGGALKIDTQRLNVSNGAEVSTISRGVGNAGALNINAQQVNIDNGRIASSTLGNQQPYSQTSNGYTSTVKDDNLVITSGGNLLKSLFPNVIDLTDPDILKLLNTFKQANIPFTIDGNKLTIGGETKESYYKLPSSIGNGGDLIINATDSINVRGQSGTIEAASASLGKAGDIRLTTPKLQVSDEGTVSVSSTGTGTAGNLDVTANNMLLDNRGSLGAFSSVGDGGDITLNVRDLLILRRKSQITATAGTAQAGGNGGNISINANKGFILAVPSENSKISANAYTGSGGKVSIITQGILGIKNRPQPTSQSDITASSTFGAQGQIIIIQPEVQPGQGITELPGEIVDASNQIGQMCSRGANARRSLGEFTITGHGSLPPSPLQPLPGTASLTTLATLDNQNINAKLPTRNLNGTTKTDTQIIEAQGWVKKANGDVELVAMALHGVPSGHPTVNPCTGS